MPCACRAPVENYPENAEWGPLFWKILHGLAELAGKQKNAVLQGDEQRAWVNVLIHLQPTLPCDFCRNHYKEWLTEHPPTFLLTAPYEDVGPWIRNYLWSLHNRINEGNDKPVLPESQLKELYTGVQITPVWKALEPIMRKAIRLSGITLLPWKKWVNYVRMLQGIYGV
jgi:hypothetical protein